MVERVVVLVAVVKLGSEVVRVEKPVVVVVRVVVVVFSVFKVSGKVIASVVHKITNIMLPATTLKLLNYALFFEQTHPRVLRDFFTS